MSARLAAVSALAAALLVAGCTGKSAATTAGTTSAAGADAAAGSSVVTNAPPDPASSATSAASPSGTAARAAAAGRLHVLALAAHLPVPLSRMVTLARPGGGLELLGGLLNGDHSSNQVRDVALPSGTVTAAGTLAVGVHDSAGAIVAGRSLVYAGGAAHEVATVQRAVSGAVAAEVGTLPQPRSDLAVATVDGRVIIVGGYDGTHTLADVLASTDGVHFSVIAQLPVPVRYPALVVRGHSVLVYGGDVARHPVGDIQEVDVAAGHATVVGHLAQPLSHEAAFDLGGSIWLAGGTGPSGTTARILRSTDGLTFTPAGTLPFALSDAGAAQIAGVGYLVGGETSTSRSRSILSLTPAG